MYRVTESFLTVNEEPIKEAETSNSLLSEIEARAFKKGWFAYQEQEMCLNSGKAALRSSDGFSMAECVTVEKACELNVTFTAPAWEMDKPVCF